MHKCILSYEEFNPKTNRSGIVTFNNVSGTITNISNIPAEMKAYHYSLAEANGLFMNAVPVSSNFSFDLNRYRTGNFSLHINIGTLHKDILNPIAEPLGLFTMNTGVINQANTNMEGDNYSANVNLLMLYTDLHLTPLKKDNGTDTNIRKKPLVSFFANVFVIKNANPANGADPRVVHMTVKRDTSEAFFSFVWKSILAAILKTIGLPEKYASKK